MAVTAHFYSTSSMSSTYFSLEWWFAYITFKTISKETSEMNKSLLGAEKATEAAGESCQWEDFTLLLIKRTKAKAALGCTLLLRPQLQSFQFSSIRGPSRQRSCSPTHFVRRLSAGSRLCPVSTSCNSWVVLFYILIEMMSPPDKSPARHCNWISGCLWNWSTAGLHLSQHSKHKGSSLSNSILIRSGNKKASD